MPARRAVLAAGLALLLSACTSAGSPSGAAGASVHGAGTTPPLLETDQASTATRPAGPVCRPASPTSQTSDGLLEVQGTGSSSDTQLWGLLFKWPPFRTGDDVKIAWRMTGEGELTLAVTRPDGSPGALDWGPDPHTGSNYNRPGEEWGAGYHLNQPGCWTLHAARGDSRADVWLDVTA